MNKISPFVCILLTISCTNDKDRQLNLGTVYPYQVVSKDIVLDELFSQQFIGGIKNIQSSCNCTTSSIRNISGKNILSVTLDIQDKIGPINQNINFIGTDNNYYLHVSAVSNYVWNISPNTTIHFKDVEVNSEHVQKITLENLLEENIEIRGIRIEKNTFDTEIKAEIVENNSVNHLNILLTPSHIDNSLEYGQIVVETTSDKQKFIYLDYIVEYQHHIVEPEHVFFGFITNRESSTAKINVKIIDTEVYSIVGTEDTSNMLEISNFKNHDKNEYGFDLILQENQSAEKDYVVDGIFTLLMKDKNNKIKRINIPYSGYRYII